MARQIEHRRGFTLIEIMVAVAILVTLIAILVPSLAHAKRYAMSAAAKAQMQGLQSALAQYYVVFHAYPSSTTPAYPSVAFPSGIIPAGRGGAMLAQGLNGYLDGIYDGAGPAVDGAAASYYGFRLNKNGATMGGGVNGPYGPLDSKGYKVLNPHVDEYYVDPWGKEILYYRSSQSLTPAPFNPTVIFTTSGDPKGLFNSADCATNPSYGANPDPSVVCQSSPAGPLFVSKVLGVGIPNSGDANQSASVAGVVGGDSFLLLSAGPDGVYFTGDDIVAGKQ